MKKIFALYLLLLPAAISFAGEEAVMSQIEAACTSHSKLSCPFSQEKYIKMVKNPIASKGVLYMDGDKMSMIYSEPDGDLLVITDGKFVMVNRGKLRDHDIREGKPMLTLRNTLLLCMKGQIKEVAEETNSSISYTSGTTDDFEITRKEDVKIGYSKIKLSFDKNSHLLTKMIMEEPTGNYTVYEIGKYDFSGNFGENVFDLPKSKK